MIKLEDSLSESDLKKYLKIRENLISGKIKRWTLPNTEEKFNSEEALKNFNALLETGFTQNQMEKMDDKI